VFLIREVCDLAARTQGEALGAAAPYVLVPHPIQDRTDDKPRAGADAVHPAVVRAATTG